MGIIERYLIRYLFFGCAASAALLLPVFSTFNLMSQLEDVTASGYRWPQALLVVVMTVPRTLVDIGPFIALLGGITGLGLLAKNQQLTAMRSAGLSVCALGRVMLLAGAMAAVISAAVDQWIAAPLQQQALVIKARAQTDLPEGKNTLWARRNNQFVTLRYPDAAGEPFDIEIFIYNPDFTLNRYCYARTATPEKNGFWTLHQVTRKQWRQGQETLNSLEQTAWQPILPAARLPDLIQPPDSFSVQQLWHYIGYLQSSGQPDNQYRISLWKKAGQPVLMVAMLLLAVPFTLNAPRASAGGRLAVGVITGLLTYISYQVVLSLGLLLSFNPLLTALLLPLSLLLLALILLRRFDRYHQ
ncbi:LPS export ABC transporter permease LptG [Tatumella punctata]|uniref:LPS export ABC transporter permease LptG n=1 Tax=Tatumella punctata TaxID=399969 RepID=A0ABW1VRP6_9GAMM